MKKDAILNAFCKVHMRASCTCIFATRWVDRSAGKHLLCISCAVSARVQGRACGCAHAQGRGERGRESTWIKAVLRPAQDGKDAELNGESAEPTGTSPFPLKSQIQDKG